jgi:hypothetical protein
MIADRERARLGHGNHFGRARLGRRVCRLKDLRLERAVSIHDLVDFTGREYLY